MVKNLILIRHGKAGARILDQLTRSRLTPRALDALSRAHRFAHGVSLMDNKEREHAQVWVSPAVRTFKPRRRCSTSLESARL